MSRPAATTALATPPVATLQRSLYATASAFARSTATLFIYVRNFRNSAFRGSLLLFRYRNVSGDVLRRSRSAAHRHPPVKGAIFRLRLSSFWLSNMISSVAHKFHKVARVLLGRAVPCKSCYHASLTTFSRAAQVPVGEQAVAIGGRLCCCNFRSTAYEQLCFLPVYTLRRDQVFFLIAFVVSCTAS